MMRCNPAGDMTVNTEIRTIGLIGKYGDPGVAGELVAIHSHLDRKGLRVLLDAGTADQIGDQGMETADRGTLGRECELVIVVGGDGTLLNAARSLADLDVAILGVNLGRLGFLVDISPDAMCETIDQALAGECICEQRFLLEAVVNRKGRAIGHFRALNDVVVHKQDVARMVEVSTYIDGGFVTTHRADGLIVATPTGSTAYALSGGGPLLHPSLEAVVLVPICPHTLSDRPVVVNADAHISLEITDPHESGAQVTLDGQDNMKLQPGDRIKIRRMEQTVRLLHPPGYDYFHILQEKLGWGGRNRRSGPGRQAPC